MRFTFGLYANRRAKALLLPALITATAVAFIAMGSLLLTVNPRHPGLAGDKGRLLGGNIGASDSLRYSRRAARAHGGCDSCSGGSPILPAVGRRNGALAGVWTITGGYRGPVGPYRKLPPKGSCPKKMALSPVGCTCRSPSWRQLTSGSVMSSRMPIPTKNPFSFLVEGVVTGPIPFGLATLETVASLPIQEPVLLVHSPGNGG